MLCPYLDLVSPTLSALLVWARVDLFTMLAMQVERIKELSSFSYGMGWWIRFDDELEPYLYSAPGAFGSVPWIDTERMIGGTVAFDEYRDQTAVSARLFVLNELIPIIQKIVDDARAEVYQ